MRLSVVLPVFNERATIREILRRVCAAPFEKEILIVDDASTDGTREELASLGLASAGDIAHVPGPGGVKNELRLLRQPRNRGKGAAVREGFRCASGDVVLIQDADLEYDPADYPKLLEPILDGRADVVFGSRFTGSPRRVLFFWHAVGNHLLTFLSNMFTNLNLTDMETGYKVFRAEILRGMPLRSERFGIEPELTAKVARRKARIYEVPVSYAGRSYVEGKKIGWKDGLAAVGTILKYAFVDDVENADPAYRTLQRMEALHRYHGWMWDMVRPHVGQRILEVGSGTGNMTRHLSGRREVVATDIEPAYLALLRRTFADDPHVRIVPFDLGEEPSPELGTGFDTITCFNVLEHVAEDGAALQRLRNLLAPGGRLILVVPALPALFGELDRSVGHHRRYDAEALHALLEASGLRLRHSAHFNTPGIVGWFVNSRILRRRGVPGVQARINDWLVPLLRFEERWQPPWGMSLLVVAERPAEAPDATSGAATR